MPSKFITRAELLDAFWSKVDVGSTDEDCWLWVAAKYSNGYGHFSVARQGVLAHRFSYETYRGPIPNSLLVLHKCDCRCCVNPSHLFLGNKSDNAFDASRKGRLNVPKKLCDADVIKIRALHSLGMTHKRMAEVFRVTRSNISLIVNRHSRKNVYV